MKLKILLLMLAGAAGVGASLALADGGRPHHAAFQSTTTTSTTTTTTTTCQRGAVLGTASAPQTFTVTVTQPGEHSSFAPGQVVTVTVGSAGQTLRVGAEGCVNGSSVTAREVGLHVVPSTTTPKGHGDDGEGHHGHEGGTTTGSTTTGGTTTTGTTTTTTGTTTTHP